MTRSRDQVCRGQPKSGQGEGGMALDGRWVDTRPSECTLLPHTVRGLVSQDLTIGGQEVRSHHRRAPRLGSDLQVQSRSAESAVGAGLCRSITLR